MTMALSDSFTLSAWLKSLVLRSKMLGGRSSEATRALIPSLVDFPIALQAVNVEASRNERLKKGREETCGRQAPFTLKAPKLMQTT